VVEDTPLLTQSLPELQEKITTGKTRPPTRQSACQRRSHFLRWKFSSYFSFLPAISNHHVTRRKARMVNSDQLFRSVRPYEHHRKANV